MPWALRMIFRLSLVTLPLFLYVGNGFERKGVPRLLRAFATLGRVDARLVVVGGDQPFSIFNGPTSAKGTRAYCACPPAYPPIMCE